MASNPWGNVGSLRNTGIEFTVNTVNIMSKSFQWTSNLVFSLNRNKVLSLDTETGTLPRSFQVGSETATVTNSVVGQPMAQFWGYKVIGRFDKAEDFYYKERRQCQAGGPAHRHLHRPQRRVARRLPFCDLNDDGVIDNNDQTSSEPRAQVHLRLRQPFSYKGFDLTLQFTGSYGNKVLNYNRRQLEITGSTSNLLTTVLNYAAWSASTPTVPTTSATTTCPTPPAPPCPGSTRQLCQQQPACERQLHRDGSYIRLQNLSFMLHLPTQWVRKLYLSNVKLYMNIQTSYHHQVFGFDPEVGSLWGDALKNGIDYKPLSFSRIYTFGINVSF